MGPYNTDSGNHYINNHACVLCQTGALVQPAKHKSIASLEKECTP